MRRQVVPVLLALVAATSFGVAATSEPAPPTPPPASLPPPALTPVLSARRVPALVAEPLGDRRLAAALGELWARGPATSCLVVTDDERVVFEREPDRPVTPASTMKLLTAAAVLERVDPSERLRTTVRSATAPSGGVVDGDLWLVGRGDPVLGTLDWATSFERQ